MKQYEKENRNRQHNSVSGNSKWCSQLNKMPQEFKQLWQQNERLFSHNQILKIQLEQKDRLIEQLKDQIDNKVIAQTKSKIQYSRFLEKQIELKTRQFKQKYHENISAMQKQLIQLSNINVALQEQLSSIRIQLLEKQRQHFIAKNLLILSISQKDTIIEYLSQISSSLYMQIAKNKTMNNNKQLITNVKQNQLTKGEALEQWPYEQGKYMPRNQNNGQTQRYANYSELIRTPLSEKQTLYTNNQIKKNK